MFILLFENGRIFAGPIQWLNSFITLGLDNIFFDAEKIKLLVDIIKPHTWSSDTYYYFIS